MPERDVGLAMIIKHRSGAGKIGEMHLVGQVKDSDCVIIDDMIDTAVNQNLLFNFIGNLMWSL